VEKEKRSNQKVRCKQKGNKKFRKKISKKLETEQATN
jgi:hypothetical protein